MALFKRRKDAEPSSPDTSDADLEVESDLEPGESAETGDEPVGDEEAAASGSARRRSDFDRSNGPFDVGETDSSGLLDLGGLRIDGVEGMQLQLGVDQEEQVITSATAMIGDSGLQLQAFAAPRSGGMWDEIRDELAAAVVAQGGTAEETDGPLGIELRTRVPTAGPDGRTVFAPARFLGVDGPRWFLRGVLSGRAAIDDDAAEQLIGVYRRTVVVRGSEPMGPRELLPLRLPQEEAPETEVAEPAPTMSQLNPFERGPEITEVG